VVGPSPRLGEVEAPPRSGSSQSSEVEVVSEPRVGRGGDCRPRSRPSPSPGVGQGGVRRLPGPSPSPSLGVGRGGVCRLPGPSPSPSPGFGRGGVRRIPGPSPSPSLTLSSGTAVGATQAALSSCQAGQWSGEVTAVTFGSID
jgi:hypothetical protein